jgi:hypothetical protein
MGLSFRKVKAKELAPFSIRNLEQFEKNLIFDWRKKARIFLL